MNKKILIIEDEKPMAKVLKMKLEKHGYEVEAVFDGLQGLEELRKDTYDLAILDLIMPNLDGFGVLETAREEKLKTPIIVASNLSQPDDAERSKALGSIGYFVKSNTSLQDLVKQIEDKIT